MCALPARVILENAAEQVEDVRVDSIAIVVAVGVDVAVKTE